MFPLAAKMLRRRLGSAAATFLALAVGVLVLTAMGTLVESGLRFTPQPQAYAEADVIVAHRTITIVTKTMGDTTKTDWTLPEGGTVPASLADRLRAVPGVTAVAVDHTFAVGAGATGHAWGSAALRPLVLTAGGAPSGPADVVLDARLAGSLRPGDPVKLTVGGAPEEFRVSGIATMSGPAGVYVTDARAATLAGHPGRADAIGLRTAPGAGLAPIRTLAASAGAEVYAGADRGRAEQSDVAGDKSLLVAIGGSFGGYVLLLAAFVTAGTVGLSVRHRRRDLALLRAIAATPGQVRRMIVAEAGLLGLAAAAVGVPTGLLAAHWVHDQMVARGFLSAAFPMSEGVLGALAAAVSTVAIGMVAALLAARRVTRIRPSEALGEAAVEPSRSGKARLVSGLVMLGIGAAAGAFTAGSGGQTALIAATGMLYLLVTGVALLAPWINGFAARLLAPVLGTVWGAGGYLAGKNLQANAKGATAVLTALVLSVGLGGSVWFLQDNLQRQTVAQTRSGVVAQWALVAPGGLPAEAASRARRIPGVLAATGVRHTTVAVTVFGDPTPVPAQTIDADGAAALDPGVRSGSLAGLRGDTVALSTVQASGKKVGGTLKVWLGDGTPATLRVVAVYDRGLGFGDVLLPRQLVPGSVDERVLVRAKPGASVEAGLAALAARYPGGTVVRTQDLTAGLATDLALSAWLNKLLIGVMVGYAALAAANTMVMAALARRRELALLRLTGVTRRQVKRMVHAEQIGLLGVALVVGATIAAGTLIAIVATLTGDPVPYVPPLGAAAILAGATLLALATTVLPIGRLLRVPAIEHIGIKE